MEQGEVGGLRLRVLAPEDVVGVPGAAAHRRPLRAIRAVHHAAARALAAGASRHEAAVISGLSPERLAALRQDPSFAALERHYAEREDARFEDVQERMRLVGMLAAEELQERILADPDSIAFSDLRKLLESALDRAGHAPIRRAEVLHATLSAEELRAMREEAIDANVVEQDEVSRCRGAAVGEDDSAKSLAPATEARQEGEGAGV